jgi:hypothetical protein
MAGSPPLVLCWIHTPAGYPHHTGIPGPWPLRATALSPPTFRPCWAPATHGTTGHLPLKLPAPQALPGSRSMWNAWSPAPLGQAPAWHETGSSTSLPGSLPLGRSWPQLYRLSRKPLHQTPIWATTRGRHTQAGLNTKGVTEQLSLQFYYSRTGDF